MEKKENRRVTMTKRLLKDALLELLAEKDIHRISIKELCEAADVNRSTFYKYYESQFALLGEMEDELIAMINRVIAQKGDHTKGLCALFKRIEENVEISRLLINNNIDNGFPEKLFSDGIIRREFLRSFQIDENDEMKDYLFNFMIYGCYRILKVWINKDNREPAEKIAELIASLRP